MVTENEPPTYPQILQWLKGLDPTEIVGEMMLAFAPTYVQFTAHIRYPEGEIEVRQVVFLQPDVLERVITQVRATMPIQKGGTLVIVRSLTALDAAMYIQDVVLFAERVAAFYEKAALSNKSNGHGKVDLSFFKQERGE